MEISELDRLRLAELVDFMKCESNKMNSEMQNIKQTTAELAIQKENEKLIAQRYKEETE